MSLAHQIQSVPATRKRTPLASGRYLVTSGTLQHVETGDLISFIQDDSTGTTLIARKPAGTHLSVVSAGTLPILNAPTGSGFIPSILLDRPTLESLDSSRSASVPAFELPDDPFAEFVTFPAMSSTVILARVVEETRTAFVSDPDDAIFL